MRAIRALAAIATAAAMLVPAPPANADEDRGPELAIKALANDITDQELAELITDYPEIAASVPDPGAVDEGELQAAVEAAMAPLASGCATVSGTRHAKSTLGFTLYRFKQSVRFCWNGSTVTSLTNQSYTMSDVDPTIDSWVTQQKYLSGLNTTSAHAYWQMQVTHCVVQVGCFGKTYPWVDLNLKGTGASTYTQGG